MKTYRFARLFAVLFMFAALFALPSFADPVDTGPPVALAVSAPASGLVPATEFAAVPVPSAPSITADLTTAISPEAQNAVLAMFLKLSGAHPWFASLLAFIALMRLWAKPLSTVVHFIIDLTPTDKDNGALNAVLRWFTLTATGQFVAYLIDWVTSIKVIAPKE